MSSVSIQERRSIPTVNMDKKDVLEPIKRRDNREFVSGWGAAAINTAVTFPLNKIIFRQQLLGITTSEALSQLRSEGRFTLYRGVLPPLLQKSISVSLMFGMYDKFNNYFQSQNLDYPLVLTQSASALMTGCVEATIMPFERIQTLLQNKFYHNRYRNTFHAFTELRVHGISEYYRGLTPILLRNGPSNILFFQFRGEIKKLLPQSDNKAVEMLRDFISGGFLGAMISTIFFPVNVVKTQMQSTVGGPFPSFWKSFKCVYAERNYSIRNLFRGVHVNYSRSLLSWGLINASYELIKNYLYDY